ncbi:ABC transporter permease [Kitasatospora sp. NPDC004799]|uniref:ABC transporter permease n=1 Tax=Kitasatospora sp. NPDC004799 TaxID=3154460 RepID=UPI0033A75EC9
MPAVDATKTVGLISLPGAMTSLILAGVDPLTAIRYQIVVMYILLAAAALAALTAARLAERALFDDAHRLYVAAESGWLTVLDNRDRHLTVTSRARLADGAHVVTVDPASHRGYYPLPHGSDGHPALVAYQPSQ